MAAQGSERDLDDAFEGQHGLARLRSRASATAQTLGAAGGRWRGGVRALRAAGQTRPGVAFGSHG
jgi:hypothetical protein